MAQHSDDLIPRHGDVLPPERHGPPAANDFLWVRTGLIDRWRGRRTARTIEALTRGLEVSAEFNRAAAAYEASHQERVMAHQRAALIPLKMEQEKKQLLAVVLERECEIEAILHRRDLADRDHKLAKLGRKEEKLRAELRIAQLEAELARATGAAPAAPTPEPPQGDEPAAFAKHFKAAKEANRNLTAAQQRIRAIYERACKELRPLTDEEAALVDSIIDAGRAAEDEVLRTSASDLPNGDL